MAEKKSFPMLPGTHWWALRDKFKQSMPGIVTDSYLAAALNMQARSARANILPYLKDVGLIDEEGKTLDLAKAWRDDHQYADVCKQIREAIYPEELFAVAPDPATNRATVERWFANQTGSGATAVRRMTQLYIILVDADVDKRKERKAKGKEKKAATPTKKAEAKPTEKKSVKAPAPDPRTPTPPPPSPQGMPGVSINLEIHISADASPDQIDKIFESMAKHVYKK